MTRTDYVEVPIANTNEDLLSKGDYVKTVYTGYRPFIPLSQQYSMSIEPKMDDNSGRFAFQPDGWNINSIKSWKAKAEVGWGKPHTDGTPGRIEAYNIVRTTMGKKPLDTAGAMQVAGSQLGSQAASKAVKAAQMLEDVTAFIGLTGTKDITKESTGEIRTSAYVNTISSKINVGGSEKALSLELAEAKKIADSYKKMLGKNESYGGFSDKGFDIGNTTDIDTQTLGYILRRLDKEFSFGNIKNIVGAEETNIGGHKLFQEALKGLDTTQERAAADIADEVDKVMGQVESFLQKNFQQALNIQEINKLAEEYPPNGGEIGGNTMKLGVVDGAQNLLVNVTSPEKTKEVWSNLRQAFKVAGPRGTEPAHENISSFSAQILDRLVKSYNINTTRGIAPENGGYIYFMPTTVKGVGTTLLAIVIRGVFEKGPKGDMWLTDITNKTYNLATFKLSSAAMIDNWLHHDLTSNIGVSQQLANKIATVYGAYGGQQMQMYSNYANSLGSLILHKTSLSGLGWGLNDWNATITLTSLLTSGDMAKNIQAQVTEQINNPKTTTKFKEMYQKLIADSNDLTKSWKSKVGMKPPTPFTEGNNFASAADVGSEHSLISEGAQSYHVGEGSPGVWPNAGRGGFISEDSGKLEGYAFTPFVDTTKVSTLGMQSPHSANALFRASKTGKKLERFIKNKVRWETGLNSKLDKINSAIEGYGDILSSNELGDVHRILGQAGIGGASKNPLLKIMWQNKSLTQAFVQEDAGKAALVGASERDAHVAKYMRILDQLMNNPDIGAEAARIKQELLDIVDSNVS